MIKLTDSQRKEVEGLLKNVRLDCDTKRIDECSGGCAIVADVSMSYDACDDVCGSGQDCTTIDNIVLSFVSGIIEFDYPDYHLVVRFSDLCPDQFRELTEDLIA